MRFATLCLACLLALPAFAGTVEKVDRLIEDGTPQEAVELAETWLEKHGDDDEADEVRKALRRAYFEIAKSDGTVASFAAFRDRYPKGRLSEQAMERESGLAWKAIRDTEDRAEVDAWLELYSATKYGPDAKKLASDLAWASAEAADDRHHWAEFADSYPNDTRVGAARKREVAAAYRDAKAGGKAKDLRGFLRGYPKAAQVNEVESLLLERFAALELPCEGKPPVCESLEAGQIIGARWERIPRNRITAHLVALVDDKERPLDEAFGELAMGVLDRDRTAIVEALTGRYGEQAWRVKLPFPLLRDKAAGFAVRLQAGDHEPLLLPFRVSATYEAPTDDEGVLFVHEKELRWASEPGDPSEPLASFPERDLSRAVLASHGIYVWGESGMGRISVGDWSWTDISADNVIEAELVDDEVFFLSGGALTEEGVAPDSTPPSLSRVLRDGTVQAEDGKSIPRPPSEEAPYPAPEGFSAEIRQLGSYPQVFVRGPEGEVQVTHIDRIGTAEGLEVGWLPDETRLAVRVNRATSGGPLLVVTLDGKRTVQVADTGDGIPDWVYDNWSRHGTDLLLPDGQVLTAQQMLVPAESGVRLAFWWAKPLGPSD
jgi:hypothetical protein